MKCPVHGAVNGMLYCPKCHTGEINKLLNENKEYENYLCDMHCDTCKDSWGCKNNLKEELCIIAKLKKISHSKDNVPDAPYIPLPPKRNIK